MLILVENLKDFFLKKYYDFDRPDISLYNFHPQLRMVFAFNGIFFNHTNSKLRFLWPVLCIVMTICAIAMLFIFIYRGATIEDYDFAIESFTYLVILGTVPLCIISVLHNKSIIINLVQEMNTDFEYICKLSEDHRKVFLKGQSLIWTLCCIWFAFLLLIIVFFTFTAAFSLMFLSLFATQNEYTRRPLLFPMWLPHDDPYRTPNYEIFFGFQICLCFVVVVSTGGYVYVLFHILIHNMTLMNIIILAIGKLFEGLDETLVYLPKTDHRRVQVQMTLNARMGQIVKWHISVLRSVDMIASIYGLPLVYQLGLSSIVICLIAYKVADALENGKFDYLFSLLFVAAIAQLWIPCYLGTIIRNKAFDLGEALWGCGWQATPLGRLLRNDILTMMSKAQQPVYIKFTGLPELELETFSSIMSSSYSYFNMLRQTCK